MIDPGIEVVTERLTVDGTLDPDQCRKAIGRWYGRIPPGDVVMLMKQETFEIRRDTDGPSTRKGPPLVD